MHKVLCENRKARHDYFIEDTMEAGIELIGCEVKSIRQGKCNLKESYVSVKNGEVYLIGCHISEYIQRGYIEVDPLRNRKLLLHKREIQKLEGLVSQKGMTLIVKSLYDTGKKIKAELCVARGKHNYDKRQSNAERDAKRKIEQAVKGGGY